MSNSPLEDFLELLRKYHRPFVGFTVQPHVYSFLFRQLKPDYFGLINFPDPTFCISNQPCEIVKWSSRKLMMKFISRKRDEELARMNFNVSEQKTTD